MKKLMAHFQHLCTPARLYFLVAVFSSVVALFYRVSAVAIGFKLLFAFVWSYILGLVCKTKWHNLSWILLFVPYFLAVTYI